MQRKSGRIESLQLDRGEIPVKVVEVDLQISIEKWRALTTIEPEITVLLIGLYGF